MDDKTGISWSDPGWPYGDLNRSTALLYFELSPFFDPSSNNAEARSRGLDPANEHVLRSMPIDRPEYVVAEAQEPHLFVIRRQARQRDGTLQHQAYYHILYMTIYQAPTLHSVISGRLRRCMFLMRQGLERVRQDLAPLPKLLLEQERKAALQAEAAAASEQGPAGGAAAAAAAAAVGEPQPLAMPEVLSREEKSYWERSDNIIMRTLQRYPMPQLPGIPAHQQPQQQQQEGAFVSTAPKAETGQQQDAAAPAAAGAVEAPPTAAAAPAGAGAAEAPVAGPPAITARAAEPVGQAKRAREAGSGAQGVPAAARSRSRTPPPAPVAAAALKKAVVAAPTAAAPTAAAPTAAAAATAAAVAAAGPSSGAGAGRAAAPTTSQTESGAAGGETSSAHQGTTASGGTAAASRAGPMKVRLKMKGLGSKPPSPALGAQGSQGPLPPPADQQPAAKRARR